MSWSRIAQSTTAHLLACLVSDRINTSLHRLSLVWWGERNPHTMEDFLIHFPIPGLNFQTLQLKDGPLHGEYLLHFFAFLTVPIAVVLDNLTIRGEYSEEFDLSDCALQSLSLRLTHTRPTLWCCGLLSKLHTLPLIRTLKLNLKNSSLEEPDYSNVILSLSLLLSKEDSQLRFLSLSCSRTYTVSAQGLLDVLPDNTTLKELEITGRFIDADAGTLYLVSMLKTRNTTLEKAFYGISIFEQHKLLHYYGMWNQAGRKIAGDPLTYLSTLCDLFVNASTLSEHQLINHSILFELLRQSPTTWAQEAYISNRA